MGRARAGGAGGPAGSHSLRRRPAVDAHRPGGRELFGACPQLRAVANYAVGTDNVDLAEATAPRHSRRQHARRAHRGDRGPGLRADARARRGGSSRPIAAVRAGNWPSWEPDALPRLRPAAARRSGSSGSAASAGGGAPRRGLRHGRDPQLAPRRRRPRRAARALRLRVAARTAHAADARPDRRARARPDEADRDPREHRARAARRHRRRSKRALREGEIAAAALDVTDPEPLPRRSSAAVGAEPGSGAAHRLGDAPRARGDGATWRSTTCWPRSPASACRTARTRRSTSDPGRCSSASATSAARRRPRA